MNKSSSLETNNPVHIKFLIDADGCIFGSRYNQHYNTQELNHPPITTPAQRQKFIMEKRLVTQSNGVFFDHALQLITETQPLKIRLGVGSNRQAFDIDLHNRNQFSCSGLFFPALVEINKTLNQKLQEKSANFTSEIDPFLLADICPIPTGLSEQDQIELSELAAMHALDKFDVAHRNNSTLIDRNKLNVIYLHMHREKIDANTTHPASNFVTIYVIDDSRSILNEAKTFFANYNNMLVPQDTCVRFVEYSGTDSWVELDHLMGSGPLDYHYAKTISLMAQFATENNAELESTMIDISQIAKRESGSYTLEKFIHCRKRLLTSTTLTHSEQDEIQLQDYKFIVIGKPKSDSSYVLSDDVIPDSESESDGSEDIDSNNDANNKPVCERTDGHDIAAKTEEKHFSETDVISSLNYNFQMLSPSAQHQQLMSLAQTPEQPLTLKHGSF